jgi:UDP-N-acetylmuramoyl-L-alanyl-D-glutamate--2,6-diaminopimelate ligase
MENYFRVKMDFFIRYAESDASMFIHVSVFDRFLHAFKPHQKPAQRIVAYGLIDEFEQISQHTPQHSFALSRDSRTISVEQKVDEEVVWSKKLPNNTHFDSLSLTNLCCSLAMIKTADLLGGDSELVTDQVQVRGRFEKVLAGDGKKPYVFVDYAHTPDALEKVLRNGRHYLSALPKSLSNSASAELWVVFGCGGDRDKGKRPLMGSAALQFADRAVVTSDNPRTESPEGIIADIVAADMEEKLHAEPNREVAINYALSNAKPGDCVIIAGKGHETYQEVNGKRSDFDDFRIVEDYLKQLQG